MTDNEPQNKNVEQVMWCRVSSREQADTGYSLQAQKDLLVDYAKNRGFTNYREFSVPESASGKKERKKFKEMLKFIKNSDVHVLICEKVDRLSRNLKDALEIDDWVQEHPANEVHFVKESIIINQSSRSNEKLVWNMKVILAKFYIDNLSEEIRKGQKAKLTTGWRPMAPPIGYKSVGEKGHRYYIPDEKPARLVVKAFNLYATGNYSFDSLTVKMNKLGLRNRLDKKMKRGDIENLLKNVFYVGINVWNGQESLGKQEPLIDKDLFKRCQEIITSKNCGGKPRKHKHKYQGVFNCGCAACNRTITWERQKEFIYGSCHGKKEMCDCSKNAVETDTTAAIIDQLQDFRINNTKLAEWILERIKSKHASDFQTNEATKALLAEQLKKLERKDEVLYDDRLDGRIDIAKYERKHQEIKKEMAEIKEEMGRINTDDDKKKLDIGKLTFAISQGCQQLFDNEGQLDQRIEANQTFLKHVFSSRTIFNNECHFVPSPPYQRIMEITHQVNCSNLAKISQNEIQKFEQAVNSGVSIKKGTQGANFQQLMPDMDSNHD